MTSTAVSGSGTIPGTVQTNSTGGASYITGTVSGLDTEALITAGYNQKLQPYNDLETQITNNTNIISSYSTLESQGKALQDAFDTLQSVTQSASNTNVFATQSVSYTASDSSTGSNIVTATTSSGSSAGTHQVVVTQLAQGLSVTSAQQSSATTALGYTGTFTIGETGKTTSTITVTSTSTLTDIENAINTTTSTSGVKANLLQVAGGGYKLVLTSNDTAQSFTATAASGDDVLQNLGITNSSAAFAHVSQVAQQAQLTLDGTSISSDSNTLSNVLDGLSLQLNNAAPNTTVTITLGNNTTGVTNAINSFVSAYNTLRGSLDSLQQINSDGTVASGAYLANDSLTRQFEQQLQASLTDSYNGSTYYTGLGAIGITIDSNNQLTVDSSALSTALTGHFSDVQALFQSTSTSTGLADTVYSTLDNYINATTGQFVTQSNTLTSNDTDLQSQAADYLSAANDYKTYLINKYAQMETNISNSQNQIAQVKAILQGSTPSSN